MLTTSIDRRNAEPVLTYPEGDRLRALLLADAERLCDCVAWLGGANWTCMTEKLIMAALQSSQVTFWQTQVLQALRRLLSFERVHGSDGAQAGELVWIDPAKARVRRCVGYAAVLDEILNGSTARASNGDP